MRSVLRRPSVKLTAAVLALTGLGFTPALVASAPQAGAAMSHTMQAGGSVDEAWLSGAGAGDSVKLLRNGTPVVNPANPGTADSLGSLIIRSLTPGPGYAWKDITAHRITHTFSVLAVDANPPTSSPLYNAQPLHSGLNYITMRDGVQLAATVRYPYGGTCSSTSPCPTVIEYSGYATAGPTDPIPFLLAQAAHTTCTGCGDPNLLPSGSTDVGAVLARVSGFATVSLQMRGTGCSGGAYDLFGFPSNYDAYDVVETVAHQNWVANHKVGMVGISYSGLSELPSAGTNPPDLAAIAPMSPTDDLFSTGYPGGIYNNGFAAGWIAERINDAKPAAKLSGGSLVPLSSTPVAGVGQSWVYYEINAELAASGGTQSSCLANQILHHQSEALASLVGPQLVAPGTGPGRDPALFDRRSMSVWAGRITAPVFISGAAQDEQTGPQWTALLTALPKTTPVFATIINGGHIDSTGPQILSQWLEFLDIYVADKVPTPPSFIGRAILGRFTSFASGTSAQAPLPALRFKTAKTLTQARNKFSHHTPRVRVLFDNGAGAVGAGDPQATYSAGFTKWPPVGRSRTNWLGGRGSLAASANPPPAPVPASATLRLDPGVRPSTDLPPGGNAWAAAPGWNWTPVPSPNGVGFQSAPLPSDVTIVGPATLNLWVTSNAPVVDLQATITEVRPGKHKETYVTSGFLRSSNQVDLAHSSNLFTIPSYLAGDAKSLSATNYSLVKVPIDPITHTFRAGTALRVVVSAPGGDRPSWQFATLDNGSQTASLGLGGLAASSLVVNVVTGVSATSTLPACGSLRGEPCRAYQALNNQI